MSYNRNDKTFNLTSTKIRYYHSSMKHDNETDCIFCQCNTKKIAELFRTKGLEVVDVGHAWLKIKAEKNYRAVAGGRTDETDIAYELISGKPARQYE